MLRLTPALLISCLLLVTAPTQSAALSHTGATPRHIQHAQQIAHEKKRMVKVRQGGVFNPFKAPPTGQTGNGDTANENDNGNGNGGGANTQSSTAATPTQSSSAAGGTQSSGGGGALESILNPGGQSSTSATQPAATSSAPSSATSATSASTPANSPSLNLVTPTDSATSATQTQAGARTILSESRVSSTPSSTAEANNASSSSFGRNSIIAIVVIASCVGGAAAIWTLIRKWKLGTSAKFDERLQPIEWNPEMEANAGAGIPGVNREKDTASTLNEKHKRTGSTGSHGSFHSGDADHTLGRNVTGNGNMFADQNPSGYAPEAHDFTAGPAPGYGAGAGAGYVDLQRSHSGSRGADLTRGPSVGHNGYGADYDRGYGQHGAYGHDAYNQDPYGGYDAYPAQQQYPQGGANQQQYGGYQGGRY